MSENTSFSDSVASMTHLSTLLSVATLQTLAVMSPGPDFAVVTRNSLLHSRKIGVMTTCGITIGILCHMVYFIFGFEWVVSNLSQFLVYIKIAGCLYMIYLGLKSFKAAQVLKTQTQEVQLTPMSLQEAFLNGFLTNALNPKAILFILSLFTVVVEKNTPKIILIGCGALIVLITLVWFLFVAISFSGILKDHFLKFGVWIERMTGGFLLFVGIKIALSCFD